MGKGQTTSTAPIPRSTWVAGSIVAAIAALPVLGSLVPAHEDTPEEKQATARVVAASQTLIRAAGWKCDQPDYVSMSRRSRTFTLKCDGYYTYTITDEGGRMVVNLEK